MNFNTNQTNFDSDLQRKVWSYGIRVIPLERTLTEIMDIELLNGCKQVYELYNLMLEEMYVNHFDYIMDDLTWFSHYEGFFDVLLKTKELRVQGEHWLFSAEKFKKLEKRLFTYQKLEKFGFVFIEENADIRIKNKNFPLFLKTINKMQPLRHKRNTPMFHCDFRVFNKKYVLTFEDIVYSLNSEQREGFEMLRNYANTLCDKSQIKSFSNKWLIFTKNGEKIITLRSDGVVEIPYNDGTNGLELLLASVKKQKNAESLIDIIKRDIVKCKLPKKECNFIGKHCNGAIKIEIGGDIVFARNCYQNINKRNLSPNNFEDYRKLIDIRIALLKF